MWSNLLRTLVVMALFGSSGTQNRTATVEGIVVLFGGDDGIAQAKVQLVGLDQGDLRTYAVSTAMDGRFSFVDVPPSSAYRLIVTGPGFVQVVNGSAAPAGLLFSLTTGQHLTNVKLELIRTGAIYGRVQDQSGKPVRDAVVAVHRIKYQSGQKVPGDLPDIRAASLARVTTNKGGEYRIDDLPPGQYYVVTQVTGSVVFTSTLMKSVCSSEPIKNIGLPGVLDRRVGYLPSYYPGTVYPDAARMINVRVGGKSVPFDLTLAAVRTYRVHGEVLELETRRRVQSGNIVIIPRHSIFPPGFSCSIPLIKGAFNIDRLPPGKYSVLATSDNLTGALDVEIGGTDSTSLSLTVGPPVSLVVSLTSSHAISDDSAVGVGLQADPPVPVIVSPRVNFTNGLAVMKAIQIWDYDLDILPNLQRGYVASTSLDDVKVEDTLRIRHETTHLEIEIDSDGCTLAGHVATAQTGSLSDVTVVLIPEEQYRDRKNFYRVTQADAAGSFSLSGVPPGNYEVFAWRSLEPGIWLDRDFIDLFEGDGLHINLSHDTPIIEVALSNRWK